MKGKSRQTWVVFALVDFYSLTSAKDKTGRAREEAGPTKRCKGVGAVMHTIKEFRHQRAWRRFAHKLVAFQKRNE